jgi:hypothetical protein
MSTQGRPTRRDKAHPLWICWRGPWPLLWACEGEVRWRIRTRQARPLRHRADHAARLVQVARRHLGTVGGRWWRGGPAEIQ